MFVVKALMLYKFPYMAGLDDNFMGKVLLIGNIGFIIISQVSRLYIGSFHESFEYQLLTGIRMKENTIFWPIFMTTILSIFGIAFGSIIMKKMVEKLKERKLQKHLKVKISTNISIIEMCQKNPSKNLEKNLSEFNTLKYNIPLWNEIQFAVIGTVIFVIGTTFHFFMLYLDGNNYMVKYKIFLYRGILNGFIFNFFLPIMYLSTKKDLLRFAKRMINNIT